MANEGREFSFTTRRFQVGESQVPISNDQTPDPTLVGIEAQTNAVLGGGVIQPEYAPIPSSGLVHDYFANTITGPSGSAVQTWEDGEEGNHATGGDPVLRSGEIGGEPALEWDQSGDSLSADTANYSSEFSAHAVFKLTRLQPPNSATIYNSGESGFNFQIKPNSDQLQLGLSGVTTLGLFGISTGTTVFSVRKASGSVPDVLINGESHSGSDSTDPNPSGNSYIGSFNGTDRPMYDFVNRILVYDLSQSDSDFSTAHEELRTMFGV